MGHLFQHRVADDQRYCQVHYPQHNRIEPGKDVTQSTGDGLSLTCSCCDQLHKCGMRGRYSNGGDRMCNPSTHQVRVQDLTLLVDFVVAQGPPSAPGSAFRSPLNTTIVLPSNLDLIICRKSSDSFEGISASRKSGGNLTGE